MARILILGAGVAGHTAACHLKRSLPKGHEIVVVSPNSMYQWIPSNIWVGIGKMTAKNVTFPLAPLYKKKGIIFKQAKATTFYPEGSSDEAMPHVVVEYTDPKNAGNIEKVTYDFLINASGPKLNFEATPGLNPGQNKVYSVCTYQHAEHTAKAFLNLIKQLKADKRRKAKILIGTGHPKATCQGAAFEYILNVEKELKKNKVRDQVELTWISNEYEVGDFGMNGMLLAFGRMNMKSKEMVEMIFEDRGIRWITGAGITKVENGIAHYENLNGEYLSEEFDFGMLIPAFAGHGFQCYDKHNNNITDKLFNGFMIVDADYTSKPFEEWKPQDWPETYQNPTYQNIFAPGIAFAPPHSISKPRKSKNGTDIFPTPPRTGMPSGVSAKVVADNIVESIKTGSICVKHKASLGKIGAACIASAGYGIRQGEAINMITYPIVPDYEKYSKTSGRNLDYTSGNIGLAGHWIKLTLHFAFLYKAKMKPFWWLIPE